MEKFDTVDDYIKSFPNDVKIKLENLRVLVKKLAPHAVESISYGMPGYKLNGKPLVYFAGYKTHIGFYPTPNGMEEFAEELKPFATGKGTAQFKTSQPLPMDLIKKIVKFRIEQISKKKT